jgi:hypothetical protein
MVASTWGPSLRDTAALVFALASYVVREGWSGADGIGAKGIESMIFTSLRYFLP